MQFSGKQRMLNAYRGKFSDRVAIAPELWYYYPAKVLGVDMIEFQRNVPFHQALKTTFAKFGCEGWGLAFFLPNNDLVKAATEEKYNPDGTLEVKNIVRTSAGELTSTMVYSKEEPCWALDGQIKSLENDLAAWEIATFGGEAEDFDIAPLIKAYDEVGDSFLLECWLGVPFFDMFAGARDGGFETAIFDFMNPDFTPKLLELREKYVEQLIRRIDHLCKTTPFESYVLGCSWSCNSLIGPMMWREWDKPVIKAVVDALHRHGKLLHIHFHGKSMETVADFAEIGIDCVCPFERPPGGDLTGLKELQIVEQLLRGKTTMNGNVHTVETLIRGTTQDVRNEVGEIMRAFAGNPRVIVGTGDQVGRETPEENIHAMIDEAIKLSPQWMNLKS
jgi:hypothetical protein